VTALSLLLGVPVVPERVRDGREGGADPRSVVLRALALREPRRQALAAPGDLGCDEHRVCGNAHVVLL
jgi:hypothetical protein